MTSIPALPSAGFAAALARPRNAGPATGFGQLVAASPGRASAGPEGAGPVVRSAPPAGLQRVLLSPHDEQDVRDDQGRRRARRLLAGLARLQLRLLAGEGDATEALAGIRDELRDMPASLHPELAAVLAAISLRVEVELARQAAD